jgi:hypothetical protein
MLSGMLWFDNDKSASLSAKVGRAAEYYRQKYGQRPNICFVHPQMVADQPVAQDKPPVEIEASKDILLHHFWIGTRQD